jgi:hypothetical protein
LAHRLTPRARFAHGAEPVLFKHLLPLTFQKAVCASLHMMSAEHRCPLGFGTVTERVQQTS